jgi:hypothetical protein
MKVKVNYEDKETLVEAGCKLLVTLGVANKAPLYLVDVPKSKENLVTSAMEVVKDAPPADAKPAGDPKAATRA